MSIERIRVRERVRFQESGMARVTLASTPRCRVDLYCLRPGQAQELHAHAGQDKVYLGVEGAGRLRVGQDETVLEPGVLVLVPAGVEHGLTNPGDGALVVLVTVAPPHG